MKLIVGLGNPGNDYTNTRHNVGFMILDGYLKDVIWKNKFNSLYYIKDDVIFIKPLTYMNNSGEAVRLFKDYYKIDLEDILVIHDDLDLNVDSYKVKFNSSDGGHNGIKSIIQHLGSKEFGRLKIGIANDRVYDVIDFVLGKFSEEDLKLINNEERYNKIIDLFIKSGIKKTLDSYRR